MGPRAPRLAAGLLAACLALLAVPVTAQASLPAGDPGDAIELNVVIPAAQAVAVSNAQLRWGLNQEATSGAHFGGCNFLSAGTAGNTGSSRIWTAADGFYRSSDGPVRIEKPNAAGKWVADSWDKRCHDAQGRTAGTSIAEKGTGAQVVIDSGVGTIDAIKGRAEIRWQGSFTMAMYGGMTYWWVSDPVLRVENGKGTLRATLGGFAADRADSSKWTGITPQTVTLANLPKVALGEKGLIVAPAYRQVAADGLDPVQDRSTPDWGAFPRDFLTFHEATGQAAYWYSSGSTRDPAKVASPLFISYSADAPVDVGPPPVTSTPAPTKPAVSTVVPAAPIPTSPGSTGTVTGQAPVPGVVRTAANSAVQAVQWVGGSLIPQGVAMAKNHLTALLWSLSGLLALAGVSWVGFRRGWLQVPWIRPKIPQK